LFAHVIRIIVITTIVKALETTLTTETQRPQRTATAKAFQKLLPFKVLIKALTDAVPLCPLRLCGQSFSRPGNGFNRRDAETAENCNCQRLLQKLSPLKFLIKL
jgi:hypothetical protein